jgi:acetolactate synthase-1/2/3 large subunit
MSGQKRNYIDGGEAILEALRELDVDYIMSSPGSEMSPVWEALARQKTEGTKGPRLIDTWHELVAVDMALGYSAYTNRMQAVFLHAGVGLLQGAMAILSATNSETSMIVMSGEAVGLGEEPGFRMEPQWYGGVSTGSGERFVQPLVKRTGTVVHPDTLYEHVIRAGELAQREQKGPIYVGVTLEVLLAEWRRPQHMRRIPPAPKLRPLAEDLEYVARLIGDAKNPVVIAETTGREPSQFYALVAFAEAYGLPVYGARSAVTYAMFPTGHSLWQGFFENEQLGEADLIILIGGRLPWYPPSARPGSGKIVSIAETPLKRHLVYQVLQADHYLEGDLTIALSDLTALADHHVKAEVVKTRHASWSARHETYAATLVEASATARALPGIEPVALASVAAEILPPETIYVDETISHMGAMRPHLPLNQPQSFFRATGGGLGQGVAISLGLKLAAKDRPVVLFVGDGSFLYNPIVQALGASKHCGLPITIIVCNNSAYETMRLGHVGYYPGGIAATQKIHYGVHIDGPEYQDLGSHFGFHGAKAETVEQLASALREAMEANSRGRSSIINVVLTR